jgi:apolipoprotein N-acyltransferase
MKILLTIVLGVLFTLCFAPHYQLEFGFICLTGLLLVLDSVKTSKKVFLYGWLFGFVHHVSGLYWISYSMLVEPDKFAWMIPFSATAIPAILALVIGLTCWMTYKLNLKIISKMLFFAAAWALTEMVRGNLFTGFPWNLVGYTFLADESIAQAASIFGVYGLSMLAVFLFTTPYLAASYLKSKNDTALVYRLCFSLCYLMPTIIAMTLLHDWGSERIAENKDKFEKTSIRIVQPNIPQKEKFDPDKIGDHLFRYYNLSLQESMKADDFVPDLIIWPEVATTLNLEEDKEFLAEVADIIPFSAYLILGTIRYEGWLLNQKIFNSVQFVDSEGILQPTAYDKSHLVPFGEYVPLRQYLPGVEKIAKGIGDFNRGAGNKTFKLDNSEPFSPLICYEIIFPGKVVDKTSPQKPQWILNLTNDAWFGNTSGPPQHLDAARMRAIEEGIPVIRSANTGISAVVDGMGRVLDRIELDKQGIIDTKLPAKLAEETYFSKYGNLISLAFAAGIMLLALLLKCISIILSKAR